MLDPFKNYFALIDAAYKAGNATEHTYRPALKILLEAVAPGVIATNEPRREKCGSPDYIITRESVPIGYLEAKDIGEPLDKIEAGEQLGRYRESLANLILTDYVDFRWYVQGQPRLSARLAKPGADGKLRMDAAGSRQVQELLQGFYSSEIPVVSSPKDLAERMAALARLIRAIIGNTFAAEAEQGTLHEQMEGFRKVLMHDLTAERFADMYAQTICYGLFAARCNSADMGTRFTREHAAYDLPKTNPFLRKLFGHIAGSELDDRIIWAVDNLAELLNRADMVAVLKNFGHSTQQKDPVVHFYETFLGAYDKKMQEARGVYYTPEPVVSYIVRSVDSILKRDFKLTDGLADAGKMKLTRPSQQGKKGKETVEVHKVQILDPAAGTGTFLHHVIVHIHESLAGNKGLWAGYVKENLLPRLYGFELLMAPYAVAHMKLGLLLRETGYDFASDERLRVYLTNTLEEAHKLAGLELFAQFLSEEANSASDVKKDAPVMVVMGNPPYSGHSANGGKWISDLLHGIDGSDQKSGDYFSVDGNPLGEKNPKWLNDDYVKFIRFAQWRIERTGCGVLAFVTNHGYLDNPTFRGMRQSLMRSFDDIYILDLHGNSKKKERAPDGGKDENVFDIQQGVAIGLFVKRSRTQDKAARVYRADLYGPRATKYKALADTDYTVTKWERLKPQAPSYLFVSQDESLRAEYELGWKITDIMRVNSTGMVSKRDSLAFQFEKETVLKIVQDIYNLTPSEIVDKYPLKSWSSRDGKVEFVKKSVMEFGLDESRFIKTFYRPFDSRWTYYVPKSKGFVAWPVFQVMQHMLAGGNLGLVLPRRVETAGEWHNVFASRLLTDHVAVSAKTIDCLFPLYLCPTEKAELFDVATSSSAPGGRRPNLALEFISDFSARLKFDFVPDGQGDLKNTFGPEDVFHYAYAVFFSPAYRRRYSEFLKMDFPRLPLTSSAALFRKLCAMGQELVGLHLMERLPEPKAPYPMTGNDTVENVRYTEPASGVLGRVWINATQYFENVPPEVWSYHVGGYQVLQKWLKDRKGRHLSNSDLTHYRGIVAALARTIELQTAIDEAIGGWPLL